MRIKVVYTNQAWRFSLGDSNSCHNMYLTEIIITTVKLVITIIVEFVINAIAEHITIVIA